MNEKTRFGKRYVQLEDGTWKYLRDTMAEEEYKDRMEERIEGIKIKLFLLASIGGMAYILLFRPDIVEKLNSNPVLNNPVVIGVCITLTVILSLIILAVVGIFVYVFLQEAIPAFKRDILGREE